MSATLVLFDFDGTITKNDSFIKFIRFVVGDAKFAYGIALLIPVLIAYRFKLIPNYKAKQITFSYFFKGMSKEFFLQMANEYSLEHIDTIVRSQAIQKIQYHKDQGHKIVIVSASIESWLKPWCSEHNLDLIATKIEISDGVLTGKFITKNCYGIQKLYRIKEIYELEDYDYIYSYGDSCGDMEMLGIADSSFYKPFREGFLNLNNLMFRFKKTTNKDKLL